MSKPTKKQLDEVLDALEAMAWQFCCREGVLMHTFMSAEENAFYVLEEYGRIEKRQGCYEMVAK